MREPIAVIMPVVQRTKVQRIIRLVLWPPKIDDPRVTPALAPICYPVFPADELTDRIPRLWREVFYVDYCMTGHVDSFTRPSGLIRRRHAQASPDGGCPVVGIFLCETLRDLDEAVFQPVLLLLFGERHDFFNILIRLCQRY